MRECDRERDLILIRLRICKPLVGHSFMFEAYKKTHSSGETFFSVSELRGKKEKTKQK
jgi:hypothetical protein